MQNEETTSGANRPGPRDIQARAFEFACRIVKLYRHLEERSSSGRVLGSQLLRSGTSVGANLEEANAGQSRADFIAKCSIALKEARETHYWLRLLAACEIAAQERLAPLISEANELVATLTTIVKNARSSSRNGCSSAAPSFTILHSSFSIRLAPAGRRRGLELPDPAGLAEGREQALGEVAVEARPLGAVLLADQEALPAEQGDQAAGREG